MSTKYGEEFRCQDPSREEEVKHHFELGLDSFGNGLELRSDRPLGDVEVVIPDYPIHDGSSPSDQWSEEVRAVNFLDHGSKAALYKVEGSGSVAKENEFQVVWTADGVKVVAENKEMPGLFEDVPVREQRSYEEILAELQRQRDEIVAELEK